MKNVAPPACCFLRNIWRFFCKDHCKCIDNFDIDFTQNHLFRAKKNLEKIQV